MDVGCCCLSGFEGRGDNDEVLGAVGSVDTFVADKAGEESVDDSSSCSG